MNTTSYNEENGKENSISFFEFNGNQTKVLTNITPTVNALSFITKADLTGQEDLFKNGEVLFELTELNNIITANAYFKQLETDCLNGSKNECQAQDKIQTPIKLVWNCKEIK